MVNGFAVLTHKCGTLQVFTSKFPAAKVTLTYYYAYPESHSRAKLGSPQLSVKCQH